MKYFQIIKSIWSDLGWSFYAWKNFVYYNFFCHQIRSTSKIPLFIKKHVVWDISNSSIIEIGANLEIGNKHLTKSKTETQIKIEQNGYLNVQSHFIVYAGTFIHILKGAKLTLGGGSFFNENVRVICGANIRIGENTAIGPDVIIRSADGHQIIGSQSAKEIIIGNHVWIGQRAIILKGVTIGDGAVIGAGSIVISDIPPHSLAAGSPAKVLRLNINWK